MFRQRGYETKRISTHAIEVAIQSYPTMADAIGFTYQIGGHIFYELTFPTGDATWVYDDSTGLWHQRAWTDQNGILHRDRVNCVAYINGTNLAGDHSTGTIYQMDPGYYYDDAGGVAGPISYIRSFPHITSGVIPSPQLPGAKTVISSDGNRMKFNWFQADIECGNGPGVDGNGDPPKIGLRWSDDRGKTYGQTVFQSAGTTGQYLTYPMWRNLGEARDRIFELSWSFPGQTSLNGAWTDPDVLVS